MAKRPDRIISPVIGGPLALWGELIQPIAAECSLCHAKLCLSKPSVDFAEQVARQMGRHPRVMCETCARPWLEDMARYGGRLLGQEEACRHFMPRIDKIRDDQTLSN